MERNDPNIPVQESPVDVAVSLNADRKSVEDRIRKFGLFCNRPVCQLVIVDGEGNKCPFIKDRDLPNSEYKTMAKYACGATIATQTIHEEKIELEKNAMIDQLTGLYNKDSFDKNFYDVVRLLERHNQKNDSKSSILLLAIDLDDFKTVNDEDGHPAGDLVLTTTGKRMLRTARPTDKYMRMGGDEFGAVLVVENEDSSDMANAVKRLKTTVSEEIELPNGKKVRVGASVGCVRITSEEISQIHEETYDEFTQRHADFLAKKYEEADQKQRIDKGNKGR